MARNILLLSKVIGTVSLGLLAGVSASSVISLPLVASAPVDTSHQVLATASSTGSSELTDAPALDEHHSKSLVELYYERIKTIALPLSAAAVVGLMSAYVFAPSYGRHPYLIYSALCVPISRLLSFKSYQRASRAINALMCSTDAASTSSTSPIKKGHKVVEDVPSMLDNSVYGRLETETEHESSSTPTSSTTIEDKPLRLAATEVVALQRKETIATLTALVGFVISTVGIYGDMA